MDKTTAILSLIPGAQFSIIEIETNRETEEKIIWLDEINEQPSDEEINAEIIRLQELESIPQPNWREFLNSLKQTTIVQDLRNASRVDVASNALATELRLALGEAALGLVDIPIIQVLLNELWSSLTEIEKETIITLVLQYNIPLQSPEEI